MYVRCTTQLSHFSLLYSVLTESENGRDVKSSDVSVGRRLVIRNCQRCHRECCVSSSVVAVRLHLLSTILAGISSRKSGMLSFEWSVLLVSAKISGNNEIKCTRMVLYSSGYLFSCLVQTKCRIWIVFRWILLTETSSFSFVFLVPGVGNLRSTSMSLFLTPVHFKKWSSNSNSRRSHRAGCWGCAILLVGLWGHDNLCWRQINFFSSMSWVTTWSMAWKDTLGEFFLIFSCCREVSYVINWLVCSARLFVLEATRIQQGYFRRSCPQRGILSPVKDRVKGCFFIFFLSLLLTSFIL